MPAKPKKRPDALAALAQAAKAPAGHAQPHGAEAGGGHREMLTTAIHLPRDQWELLRVVAFRRAEKSGGRPSVSALLVELIEQHRAELAKEAGR